MAWDGKEAQRAVAWESERVARSEESPLSYALRLYLSTHPLTHLGSFFQEGGRLE
jgi:hypothetical protein